jgi:hypothetical protein
MTVAEQQETRRAYPLIDADGLAPLLDGREPTVDKVITFEPANADWDSIEPDDTVPRALERPGCRLRGRRRAPDGVGLPVQVDDRY